MIRILHNDSYVSMEKSDIIGKKIRKDKVERRGKIWGVLQLKKTRKMITLNRD